MSTVEWGTTDHLIVANVDGEVHTAADEWKGLLSRQLTSPVEFLSATLRLPDTVTTTIEMPPGSVLTGLTKRIRDFDRQLSPASYTELKDIAL